MMSKRGWIQLAVYYCALVFGLFPMQTYAQGAQTDVYPQRSVRIVVPVSAGGSTDKIARLIAEGATAPETLRQKEPLRL